MVRWAGRECCHGVLAVARWWTAGCSPSRPSDWVKSVMGGKERTIVCKSGTYTVGGQNKPAVAHFNNMGLEVKDTNAFVITGQLEGEGHHQRLE